MKALRRYRIIPPLLVAAALVAGCGRSGSRRGATTRPAGDAAVTAPATSVVSISGRSYTFPAARLIVDPLASGEPGVVVRLYSEGASPEGTRDGYYLEMALDVPDGSRLDGASWQYTSDSDGGDEETPSAITVNGGANQLRPKDVTATFRAVSADVVEVRLNGFFGVFDARKPSAAASGVVPVEATVLAKRQASR